ncbi:MAG TPA: hypothetical protein VEI07_11140 [Planctomycetaceae bacterium]|nr:hypothetical protein [Planctomycetaceae bacterium]
MGWLEIIGLGIAVVLVGFYVLTGVAIVVTALVERRPVRHLTPAEPDDPIWQTLGALGSGTGSPRPVSSEMNADATPQKSTYAETRALEALRLGFSAPRLFKHAKGGIYRTCCLLTVSASQQILAVIRWGTTGSIRDRVTMLYSVLDDGRYLVTSDRVTGSRVPGLSDDLVLPGAAFEQLFERHEARLQDCGENLRMFDPSNPLAGYETLQGQKASFLIARGDAYWLDPRETEYRFTLRGALQLYGQVFSTSHVDRTFRPAGR